MEQKNKKTGVLIMLIGAVSFFVSFIYFFGWSTGNIEYGNLSYMLKLAFTFSLSVFGLYFGLLFYGGKKIAMKLGGGLGLLLALAYVIGFVLHQ
jgi:hypothetical protein